MRSGYQICIGWAALLALTACAGQPGAMDEDAWLQKIYANSHRDIEVQVIASSPGRAARKGDDLILALADGKSVTLRNDIGGCADGPDHCTGYYLAADLPSRHFYFVQEYYYEGYDDWLIDDRTGRKTEIESVPIFSPDGSRFLVQNDDEASDHDNNLEIWRRDKDGAVIEWAHPTVQAGTEFPSFALYHTSVTSWRDGKIILAFGADGQLDKQTKQIVFAHNWTGTITHDNDGWRLQADWPKPDPVSSRSP